LVTLATRSEFGVMWRTWSAFRRRRGVLPRAGARPAHVAAGSVRFLAGRTGARRTLRHEQSGSRWRQW